MFKPDNKNARTTIVNVIVNFEYVLHIVDFQQLNGRWQ